MLARGLRFDFSKKLPRNSLSFPSFNIRYDKNELGKLQAAVVVSKKVDKRATIRNRLKRIMTEQIRMNLEKEASINLVLYIKQNDEEALLNDFNSAVKKIIHETIFSG